MTREELFALAERHGKEVWGGTAIGEGHQVLDSFGIEPEHFAELSLQLAVASVAAGRPNVYTHAALILQGFVFGLWLSEQER